MLDVTVGNQPLVTVGDRSKIISLDIAFMCNNWWSDKDMLLLSSVFVVVEMC
jgi:hypothetical protein